MGVPRVAYFPDSFHEVNGVAHTSRNFVAYAERRQLPMLCVRAGTRGERVQRQGSVTTLELRRSRFAVGVEKDLAFDPVFLRHGEAIAEALHGFRPDVIHMTGPSELGLFAAWFARKLEIPLAASWHTNVHEYAGTRLPKAFGGWAARLAERTTLAASMRLYARAQVLFAPNPELCAMLSAGTGRPCGLMQRGVDTTLFTPGRRTRAAVKPYVLGFVGRLSVEKNVALLPRIQRKLDGMGLDARFLIVGHGAEEATLRRELPTAEFAGVLRGEALAGAYANMDLLVFPSHTDTFGNVVLEALASGVPAVVTPDGGPRYIVRTGRLRRQRRGWLWRMRGLRGRLRGCWGMRRGCGRCGRMLARMRRRARGMRCLRGCMRGMGWDSGRRAKRRSLDFARDDNDCGWAFGLGLVLERIRGWGGEQTGAKTKADSLRE